MLPFRKLRELITAIVVPFVGHGDIGNLAVRLSPRPACFRRLFRSGKMPSMSFETNGGPPQRLFAVRGATQVEANEAAAIVEATEGLMRALIERNGLTAEAMVSCIFTTTDDLDAEFPAVAARKLGFERVPLLCAREVAVPGSLPQVVRVLIHYHAPEEHRAQHVYLGDARKLRSDLDAAQ